MKLILRSLPIFLIILSTSLSRGAILYSIVDGNWGDGTTWSPTSGGASCNCTPGGNDEVYIESDVILNVDVNNPGVTLHVAVGASLTGTGTNGIFINTNGSSNISGTIDIYEIELKNGTTFSVVEGATANFSFLLSGNNNTILVDGDLTAGTIDAITITGTGTVTATTSYTGTYNIYGATTLTAGTTYYGQGWQGDDPTTPTDWADIDNWASGEIPTSSTKVQLPSGLSNYPVITSNAQCSDLVIESGASVTINPGFSLTVNGTLTNNAGTTGLIIKSDATGTASLIDTSTGVSATVERYIPTGDWHQVSVPVSSATTNYFYGYYLYYWDEPSGWANYVATTPNITNTGAYGFCWGYYTKDVWNGNNTISFTGTLNNGDYTLSNLNATHATYPGSHMIGNPYTAALDLEAIYANTNTNISSTYYERIDASTMGTYDASTSTALNGASRYIPVGQAFWVEATASSAVLHIDRGDRVHNTANFRNHEKYDKIFLSISAGNSLFDETAIVFTGFGTNAYDPIYDGTKKFAENPKAPQIYSVLDNAKEISINNLSEPKRNEVEKVQVEAIINEGKNILHIRTENMPLQNLLLEDLSNGNMVDLSQTNTYEFVAEEGESTREFILHFTLPIQPNDTTHVFYTDTSESGQGGTTDINEEKNIDRVYSTGKNIYIQTSHANALYSILDINGKKVKEGKLENKLNRINTRLPSGNYIVRVYNKQEFILNKKVFIQ